MGATALTPQPVAGPQPDAPIETSPGDAPLRNNSQVLVASEDLAGPTARAATEFEGVAPPGGAASQGRSRLPSASAQHEFGPNFIVAEVEDEDDDDDDDEYEAQLSGKSGGDNRPATAASRTASTQMADIEDNDDSDDNDHLDQCLELEASDLIELGAYNQKQANARRAAASAGPGEQPSTQSNSGLDRLLAHSRDERPFAPRLQDGPRAPDEEEYSLGENGHDSDDAAFEDEKYQLGPSSSASTQARASTTARSSKPHPLAQATPSATVDIVLIADEGVALSDTAAQLAESCGAIRASRIDEGSKTTIESERGVTRNDYFVANTAFSSALGHLWRAERGTLVGFTLAAVALAGAGAFFNVPAAIFGGLTALAIEILLVRLVLMRKHFQRGRVDMSIWRVTGDALMLGAKDGSSLMAELIDARAQQSRPSQVTLVYVEDPLLIAPIQCQDAHQRRRRLEQTIAALARHHRHPRSGVDIRVVHCVQRAELMERIVAKYAAAAENDGPRSVGIIPQARDINDDVESIAPVEGGYYVDVVQLAQILRQSRGRPTAGQRAVLGADLDIAFDTSASTSLDAVRDEALDTPRNHSGGPEGSANETRHAIRAMLDSWELHSSVEPEPLPLALYGFDRKAPQKALGPLAQIVRTAGRGLAQRGWSVMRRYAR